MTELTLQQAFEMALVHHQAGRLQQAEQIYRQILLQFPQSPDVLQNLAILVGETGRKEAALDLSRRVVTLKPDSAEAFSNLGNALNALGQNDEAIEAYRHAITLNPDFPAAHYNLGNVLKAVGKDEEAIAAYQRAIELKPDYDDAYNNLANLLAAARNPQEAADALRRAIAMRPGLPGMHFDLGFVLGKMGHLDDAITAYRKAIALRPDYAEACCNLGNALKDRGLIDEAIAAYDQALAINPGLSQVHNNLGTALLNKGQIDEAIAAHRRAIALDPGYAGAHNNLGLALKETGQLDEAIAEFRKDMELHPDFDSASTNLLLAMQGHDGFDAHAVAEEHRRWNVRHAEPLRKLIRPHTNSRQPDRRLRIGYVSPDFRSHVVARFLLPLLERHDRGQFEVFCYSNTAIADDVTLRIRRLADHWRQITHLGDEHTAEQIRADRIDILIDLAGHTSGNRLQVFARKPAPVQVSWLGYPGSTGMSAIDYRLGDALADPLDQQDLAGEVFRLPRTNWCFTPVGNCPPIQPPPAMKEGFVTFGSFNTLAKLNDRMLALWARILRETPGSKLFLKAAGFGGASVRDRMARTLAAEGIGADRLILRGQEPDFAHHLALYGRMDIALDTFPYHGTSTTCDALWMGVPVVTLAGRMHVSRVGVSLLNSVGLQDLIADSSDRYIQIATELARDTSRLESLRRGMRERMIASPLMDGEAFARDIESAYRQMWHTWCKS